MRVKDLRIGNYVNFEVYDKSIVGVTYKQGRVTSISEKAIVIDNKYSCKVSNVHGIELNEDMKRMFGCYAPVYAKTVYLHEIQNFYFITQGKELNIQI